MVLLASFLQGCQINYILKSGYNQALLLRARQPIDEALQDPAVPEEFKRKLRLTQEAKHFAETTLRLKPTQNYDSFVMLNRDAVTWAVSAAPRFELSAYLMVLSDRRPSSVQRVFHDRRGQERSASARNRRIRHVCARGFGLFNFGVGLMIRCFRPCSV